MKETCFCK